MKSFRICMQNIRKWSSNSRIKMCLVLSVLFVYAYTKGIGTLSAYLGKDVSPWIYPFLFTYRYMKIVFMAPIIFIFCDAPFVDTNQMYVMLRTKRSTWCRGQLLYIVTGSFLYAMLLMLSSMFVNIGHMEWNTAWGDVLGVAATTNILSGMQLNYTTIKVSSKIVLYFTPLQAMFFSFILMWLSFIFIGLIIYVLNVATRTKLAGVFTAGFFVLLTALADGNTRLTWFSPISWNSLNIIDVGKTTTYPTIDYVLAMYIGMIIILAVLAVILGRKQEIIVQEEM